MECLEEELRSIVGAANLFAGGDIEARYTADITHKYHSQPGFVVRPADTAQIVEIVKLAGRRGVPITPLGGRTGVVGGGMASDGGIVLSLERMNRILEIDEQSMTMTVEAGTPLQLVQEAAEAKDFIMPLDLGARGSATIGGNIATNAGGNRVLRWGMAGDMVIGLEAVLADGSVVSSLTKMLKDNAGYRWKDLLVGSEGTLGIITRAVLRLRPLPRSRQTALVAMSGFDCVPRLLRRLEARFAGQLSSFELMWNDFYEYVSKAQLQHRPQPMPPAHALYALIETLGGDPERDTELFQEVLAEAQEGGLIEDAVIAQTARDRTNLWAVRDDLGEAMRPMQPAVAFDVSMALQDMPAFVEMTKKALLELRPATTVLYYGHAGDGNLHLAVSLDKHDPDAYRKVDDVVYGCLAKLGGSVSGEHGIGTGKLDYLAITRSPEEIALMRSIKHSLDPKNILNPGKILPATA